MYLIGKIIKLGLSSIGIIIPKGDCNLLKLHNHIGKPVRVSINKEKNNLDKKGLLEVEIYWADWEEGIFD